MIHLEFTVSTTFRFDISNTIKITRVPNSRDGLNYIIKESNGKSTTFVPSQSLLTDEGFYIVNLNRAQTTSLANFCEQWLRAHNSPDPDPSNPSLIHAFNPAFNRDEDPTVGGKKRRKTRRKY